MKWKMARKNPQDKTDIMDETSALELAEFYQVQTRDILWLLFQTNMATHVIPSDFAILQLP